MLKEANPTKLIWICVVVTIMIFKLNIDIYLHETQKSWCRKFLFLAMLSRFHLGLKMLSAGLI